MQLSIETAEVKAIVRDVVAEVLAELNWPQGRLALDEAEAAAACGVGRHVLRDLRLGGRITGRKLGKKVVYLRADLLAFLEHQSEDSNAR